jgi:hypothetical protein
MTLTENIQKVLQSALGAAAAWVVNDPPIDILICATAVNGHNWFFVKDEATNKKKTGSVKLVDAAVASSGAPTYFNHWTIDGIDGKNITFFDEGSGGTTNPPIRQASKRSFTTVIIRPRPISSLWLRAIMRSTKTPQGLIQSIGWVTNSLVDASEDWVDKAVHRQWPGLTQVINVDLPSDIGEDDLSAIPVLLEGGKKMADWDCQHVLETRGAAATV